MIPKIKYFLHLADTPMILGQRLGEWCGHGPVLEHDIALTNIALDLIGQARLLYQFIAADKTVNSTEDKLAMLRYEHEYYNLLLVEQPNKDFGHTIMRQFLYDAFNLLQYQQLSNHQDDNLKSIAVKTIKEIKYHYRYSSEWVLRLGEGTETSHSIMQNALNELWRYTGEMFESSGYEKELINENFVIDSSTLFDPWSEKIEAITSQAGLIIPKDEVMIKGGKEGKHTEHMGYILTELQYMQRTYPEMHW
ncbi:MAG TPA: 1,2-phenylacetyl-CoA epoxidase subunit PaaC [Saprospiraceae bacterium]|nr:1,2-phenylacetyl-CoA epoxidase subunit PaaC [Saprospiraceae bacterium]